MPLRLLLALLVIGISSPLLAGDLTIRAGGDRVVGFSLPSCSYTLYSPSIFRDPAPAIPGREMVMYSAGGLLVDPCTDVDFMSPARFGDKIWYHYRDAEGVWRDRDGDAATIDEPIIDRHSFPWMNDAQHLSETPGSYVGHVSSPSVVKVDGRYFMIFVAVINDPYLCAGEHHWSTSPCGACDTERWSFFVPMWAVSDDGENWRVWEGRPFRMFRNRAANAALFWLNPTQLDVEKKTAFQGVVRTSMVTKEEGEDTWFYIAFNFSGRYKSRTGMVRLKYDPASEWGWSADPELWDTRFQSWMFLWMGALPTYFNDRESRSNIFEGYVASITETALFPDYRYIALLSSSSGFSNTPGNHGFGNEIAYQLSNDLVKWTRREVIESAVPYFADGSSYDLSVIDPYLVEDRSGFDIYFASADGDRAFGIPRDGIHDCQGFFYVDIPTTPFIGLGIYAGRGGLREVKGPDPDK